MTLGTPDLRELEIFLGDLIFGSGPEPDKVDRPGQSTVNQRR